MRVAVIGLGDIAQKAYLPIVAARSDVELTLCTRNPAVLNAIAAKYRIADTASDVNGMLSTGLRPAAAFVHTATESHPEIVARLLNHGIHVYVDKPLAYRLDDARMLVELAEKNGLILMVGFNRRFAPMVAALNEVPERRTVIMQKNRLLLPSRARPFVFDDFIHVVDTLRYLAPPQCRDIRVSSMQKEGLLCQVMLQLEGPDGMAIGLMNRDGGTTEERLEVMSPANKWVVEELSSTAHYAGGEERRTGFNGWETTLFRRGFCQIVDHFLDCVAHRKTPSVSAQDALETHALCERIVDEIERQAIDVKGA